MAFTARRRAPHAQVRGTTSRDWLLLAAAAQGVSVSGNGRGSPCSGLCSVGERCARDELSRSSSWREFVIPALKVVATC
jgi:hypothetical protein